MIYYIINSPGPVNSKQNCTMLRNYAVLHDAALLHQEQSQGEPRAKWLPWPQAEDVHSSRNTSDSQRSEKSQRSGPCIKLLWVFSVETSATSYFPSFRWPLVFDRRRRSRSRSRSGSLIAGVVRRQRCQRICRCSTSTKAVAETAGGDWRSVREITGKLWNRELSSSAVVLVWPNQAFLCAQVKMSCWVHQMRFQKEFGDQHFQAQLRKSETPFMRPVFKWLENDWYPFVDWSSLLSLLVYNPCFELPVWKIR